ncbi:hypothetical protein Hanom_Chr02g00123591 [Helianthus anomalus]
MNSLTKPDETAMPDSFSRFESVLEYPKECNDSAISLTNSTFLILFEPIESSANVSAIDDCLSFLRFDGGSESTPPIKYTIRPYTN